MITLTSTAQVMVSPHDGGPTEPTVVQVYGEAKDTAISVWEYSVDGGSFSATEPAGVSRAGNLVSITGEFMTARTIAVRMADANGRADVMTVAKLVDGAPG